METKICSNCKEDKDVCEFGKSNRTKSGLRSECKVCRKQMELKYKEKRQEYYKKYYILNREKKINYQKIYYNDNLSEILNYHKTYYNNNLEKIKNYSKHYRLSNLEKIKNYSKKYDNEKYNSDFLYRLKKNIRHRIKFFLKIKNIKKNNKTFDIVGCTPEFLREYIEKQFKNGMSWDNYGFYGWHIDHIIPLSSGNTEEEVYKLCHYTNLQPLWAEDNLKKSNKIIV
jgi:hypothetical protein